MKRFIVVAFISEGSYITVASSKDRKIAIAKADRILFSGARALGDTIRLGVWDSTMQWEDRKAWYRTSWRDCSR